VHLSNKLLFSRFAQGLLPCLLLAAPPTTTAPAFSYERLALCLAAGGVGALCEGACVYTTVNRRCSSVVVCQLCRLERFVPGRYLTPIPCSSSLCNLRCPKGPAETNLCVCVCGKASTSLEGFWALNRKRSCICILCKSERLHDGQDGHGEVPKTQTSQKGMCGEASWRVGFH